MTTVTRPFSLPPQHPYNEEVNTQHLMTSNPYAQHLLQKGYTESELRTPSKSKRTYPYTIGLRTFHTEEEYQNALHNFLNGY